MSLTGSKTIFKLKWKYSIVFFVLIFFNLTTFSQSKNPISNLDNLAEQLHTKAKKIPLENVYLQTSKGIYESGEDLWFRAYILDAQSFIPAVKSQTLYLQLINENNKKPIWQEQYEINNGFTNGQVYLLDSLAEGEYMLQAFTANSFYADSNEFKALRKVQVVKDYKSIITSSNTVTAKSTEQDKKNIQFSVFPEGGKLVNGLPTRLSFKAVDSFGKPVKVSGILFQDGKALQKFKSEHAGMGSLDFSPIAGKQYQIRLTEPATDSIFSLPKIHTEGISLSLMSRDSSRLVFVVKRTGGTKGMVYLRGQLRGQTSCIASALLDKELVVKIPLKEFSQQGIAEFTLFDENLLPVAERLAYVHPQKKLYISTQLSKQQLNLREKAELKIKVLDEEGQPVVAHLGVSIFDKLYENQKDAKNILNHYYLSEQLKGRIYDPTYYFDEKHLLEDREQALDLLLLTQGWRNYVWSEDNLAKSKSADQQLISDGIAGEVHFTKKLKQAPKGIQFIQAFSPDEKGASKYSSLIKTDSTGKFVVTSQDFKASQGGYLYLKPISVANFEPRISLDTPFAIINKAIQKKEIIYPSTATHEKEKKVLNQNDVRPSSVKLNEVVVKAKGISIFRDKYLGKLDSLAKAEVNTDFVGVPCNVLNCFQHKEDRSKKPINGETYYVHLGKNKEILGADYLNNFWYGTSSYLYSNPNLIFTEKELLMRNNLTKQKGYYAEKEFYQPNYDKEPAGDGLPDARNTLLWAPEVITDKNGEATISFFCSDINTAFLGKIEGVSGDGLLGMGGFEFGVLKQERLKENR
ncbi:hypothetical protein ADIARSV_1510 [Arcticibacter svalbardensis MN12-7]|uniref:Macroglobulin domain-containing protein n=1 Tax=Arcticibacter svalbardensis MN12-7 TaxID=1150600 RepID=R9GUW7_9SPHI|nr:hypothetical protein [Arcticibacter svalbardensis]EOR95315.1 hypothetical protein ADIARSV_1510 [Arcticibacter svalbardensis MN12-7]